MDDEPRVLRFSGRIDATTAPEMEKTIFECLGEGSTKVIIDLESVDYMSSAGLRVLLSALKKMKSVGGDLRLSSLQPHVREVFEMTGFSRLFTIFPTVNEAKSGIKS
ncbi:MAG TPA: STAS domain-containing protein [Methanoregulaceae archaeon]|nr:STAS domain-containing protein [Methanoregulaceae archaeon]